jgi:hypothetical protein
MANPHTMTIAKDLLAFQLRSAKTKDAGRFPMCVASSLSAGTGVPGCDFPEL